MKYTILLFKFLFIFFISQANISFAVVQNKIVANVGNQIISSYELKNKIKTMLFLSNQELSQDNINRTKSQAMRSLINYKLKKQEVLKFNIDNNQEAADDHLKNISSKYDTNIGGLKKIFLNKQINFDLFEDEIQTEFSWQRLIFSRFGNKINLNEKEINDELNDIIKIQQSINEYKLAEIEILVENNLENEEQIKGINNQIEKIGFENTAIKYSTSSSALDGGHIGWVSSKSLSDKFLKLLKKMKIGDVSKPIIQSNTITFLKLLDKKTLNIDNVNLNQIRENIISKKKNELLNLYSNNYLSKIKNNAFIQFK
tara:strand:- start:2659 stop:3600 length:942 start_codon:yes stop_codon:yes gene_type:complete